MRPVTVVPAHRLTIDVSNTTGYGGILNLLARRHEANRLPPPVSITLNGEHGITVQFVANDHAAVHRWAEAFGLPVPRLSDTLHAGALPPNASWRAYRSRGVCFRFGIEVWCVSTESNPDLETKEFA